MEGEECVGCLISVLEELTLRPEAVWKRVRRSLMIEMLEAFLQKTVKSSAYAQ